MPAEMVKSSTTDLLYKMYTTKIASIIRAFRAFRLRMSLQKRIAAKQAAASLLQKHLKSLIVRKKVSEAIA